MASLLECQTASEVFENYKAVRSRLRALKSPAPVPLKPEPVVRKIEITEMPQLTVIQVHQQEAEPIPFRKHPSVNRIIDAVCEKYKISRTELLAARKMARIVRLRHIVMYLARQLTLRSLPEIGRQLRRDHTSVLHGTRKITTLRTYCADLDGELTELETILGGKDVNAVG